jgi:Heterokaryon incompatibility protein (HET)
MASQIEDEHASHSQKPRDQLYSQLDPRSREIRLIQLLPGSYDDYVCCHMVVVSLSNEPKYKALSYTWGDLQITLPICVDGCILSSTLNLESALRQFRQRNEVVILWIDAICINQLDNGERTQQVALMGDIYSQSQEVVIWLGKDLESSTVGIVETDL